jgi:hypothetical protein
MRPQGGSEEALRAWNARRIAEMFAGPERTSKATPTQQSALVVNQDSTAVAADSAVQAVGMPPEPVPSADSDPRSAASTSPTADRPPSLPAQLVAQEAPVRLPSPFNLMNQGRQFSQRGPGQMRMRETR